MYVISGSLAVSVGGEDHVLNQGDSIYFDPSPAHSDRRVGKKAYRAVVVTTA